jgi:hypothetical protein
MTAPLPEPGPCPYGWCVNGLPPVSQADIERYGLGAVALGYAVALGLAVFPLKPGTKEPATPHGFHDASRDPAVITSPDWWGGNDLYGIGVPGGQVNGLLVTDFDRKGGEDGVASFAAWLAGRGLTMPPGPWVATPHLGAHPWLRLPPGRVVPSRNAVLPGVDLKADGGYVVAPPTHLRKLIRPGPEDPRNREPVEIWLPYEWHGCAHQAPLAQDRFLDELELLEGHSSGGHGGGNGGVSGDELPPTEVLAERGIEHPHDANLARLAARLARQGKTEAEAYAIWLAVAGKTPTDPAWPFDHGDFRRHWRGAAAKFPAAQVSPETMAWAAGTVPQQDDQQPPAGGGLPQIDCGHGKGPEVIRAVTAALNAGEVPWTWVTDGQVVILEWVTGSPDMVTAEGNRPLPVAVSQASPAAMASLLAHTTYTFRLETASKGRQERREFTPEAVTLAAVLKPRNWPGLPVLNGIIGSPVLRPDGTLLTAQGYDRSTGLYLASRVRLPKIPERPDEKLVAWARDALLGRLLANFPWAAEADKANYLAMLVTQIIRRWLRGAPVPLAMITSTDASAGKTLLATIPGTLFGYVSVTWTDDETELRKQLTTVMLDQAGVIGFDNVPRGTVVRSATLSKLLTDRTWGDRLLGGNVLGRFANDRLWVVTGNNLRIGGDNRTRAVLVALEPGPHPERRSGFVIPDLEAWIEEPASQKLILTALLVLVADWSAAGCPPADVVPMRQFTSWARAAGGLLAHHGVEGFLGNAGELESMDDDDADWAEFLARWASIFGRNAVTAEQLCKTAWDDRWGGIFPTAKGGQAITSRGLGRRLTGIRGSHHGGFVLRSQGAHASQTWYCVEPSSS